MVSVIANLPLFKMRTNLPVEATILQETGNQSSMTIHERYI